MVAAGLVVDQEIEEVCPVDSCARWLPSRPQGTCIDPSREQKRDDATALADRWARVGGADVDQTERKRDQAEENWSTDGFPAQNAAGGRSESAAPTSDTAASVDVTIFALLPSFQASGCEPEWILRAPVSALSG